MTDAACGKEHHSQAGQSQMQCSIDMQACRKASSVVWDRKMQGEERGRVTACHAVVPAG